MVTWNVAGVAAEQFATFLDQVEMIVRWDFFALQEGLRQLEGIGAGAHGIYTPPNLEGGLRCPAVVINRRHAAHARYAGGHGRLVAVDVENKFLVLSAHLPHTGLSLMD